MTMVYVSLGSNINKTKNIRVALDYLYSKFNLLKVSSVYESESVGFSGYNFYNLVVCLKTNCELQEIYSQLRFIEFSAGRKSTDGKNQNRSIDIDLLTFGNRIEYDGHINVPREDILRFPFVLRPLAEIAPSVLHPELLQDYRFLWGRFKGDRQAVWAVDFSWRGKLISFAEHVTGTSEQRELSFLNVEGY